MHGKVAIDNISNSVGFASGLGLWVHNIKELAEHHKVYAIDLPGFGRSSRKPFQGKTHEEAEEFFVEALEAWRKSIGLEEKFILIGIKIFLRTLLIF